MPTAVPPSASSRIAFHRAANHALVPAERRRPAADLLPQRQRGRILQVGAADFNHVGIFLRAEALKRRREPVKRRQDMILRRRQRRNMHRRRKVSLELWDLFTWSLGAPAFRPAGFARAATTSLTFMLLCVPLPVRQTTSGNSSSSLPARISSQAAAIGLRGAARIQIAEFTVGQRGRLFSARQTHE